MAPLEPPDTITLLELIATEQVLEGYPAFPKGLEMDGVNHWSSGVNNSVLRAAPPETPQLSFWPIRNHPACKGWFLVYPGLAQN